MRPGITMRSRPSIVGIRGAAEIRPDVGDAAGIERDVDSVPVDVALFARIPGNRPAGILDDCCAHGRPRVRAEPNAPASRNPRPLARSPPGYLPAGSAAPSQ